MNQTHNVEWALPTKIANGGKHDTVGNAHLTACGHAAGKHIE